MLRRVLALAPFLLLAAAVPAAAAPPDAVADYEARLEEISKEVVAIRQELETLVAEVVEGESGRVLVFLERPGPEWKAKGGTLVLDGKRVFSRAFTPAELDVLERGLPLELGEWRLLAGDHRVALGVLGQDLSVESTLSVSRGVNTAWVATPTPDGTAWRAE